MPDKTSNFANDDWLKYDPLGLDMMGDELDEEALDNEALNHEPFDTHLSDGQSHDNASKPMSTPNMPEAQTMTTDTIINNDNPDMATDEPKFDGDTSRANPYFKPLLPKPIHRHESDRQLIMDTETTGLDPQKGDRIIEVGIVEMIGRKFTGEKLHVYINPQRGMDEEEAVALIVNGFCKEVLQTLPMEFAVEAQKLVGISLEGSVG